VVVVVVVLVLLATIVRRSWSLIEVDVVAFVIIRNAPLPI